MQVRGERQTGLAMIYYAIMRMVNLVRHVANNTGCRDFHAVLIIDYFHFIASYLACLWLPLLSLASTMSTPNTTQVALNAYIGRNKRKTKRPKLVLRGRVYRSIKAAGVAGRKR